MQVSFSSIGRIDTLSSKPNRLDSTSTLVEPTSLKENRWCPRWLQRGNRNLQTTTTRRHATFCWVRLNIYRVIFALERKLLTTFSKNLANYRGKKKLPNASNFPEEHQTAKLYYDGVSDYLGSKLESIRHIDGNYEVSKVDLVSGKIITKSGKEIRLKVMGTGQTQRTYLQSKLKENYGNRKLIVMFDEVGMMDGTSMEPIKELIRKLKESGNLLVGLVVQRLDSGVKITPI